MLENKVRVIIVFFNDGKNLYLPSYTRRALRKVNLENFPGGLYLSTASSAIDLYAYKHGYGTSCTDGNYGYLLPNNTDNKTVLKIDLNNLSVLNINQLNLQDVVGLDNDNDFYFFSSFLYEGYIYAPSFKSNKIIKIDLNNFTPSGVSVLEIPNSECDKGFGGICTDGFWIYLSPNGMVFTRILLSDFKSIQYINLTSTLSDDKIDNNKYLFGSCVHKDRYVYYAPLLSKYILRIDKLNWKYGGVDKINTEELKNR